MPISDYYAGLDKLAEDHGGTDFVKISPSLQNGIEVLRIAHNLQDKNEILEKLRGLRPS